jgi:hypothetical protein
LSLHNRCELDGIVGEQWDCANILQESCSVGIGPMTRDKEKEEAVAFYRTEQKNKKEN